MVPASDNQDFNDIPDSIREKVLSSGSMAIWPIDENPLSDSYQTARYFQDLGWRIYPVHDRCERILDEPCFRDIRLIPDDYDILLLFCAPDRLPETVNAIFNADFVPSMVWTHICICDQKSYDRLVDGGVDAVMGFDLREAHRRWSEE
jgi:predicted CoA-binding protein